MKYEITKEQILETIRTGTDVTERYFKEIIPEAFKKELEIGKWYKRPHNSALFYVTEILNIDSNHCKVFGFDNVGKWMPENAKTFPDNDFEATPEQIESALINEAKKRGFIDGVKFKDARYGKNSYKVSNENIFRLYNNETLCIEDDGNVTVFYKGNWAQILPQEKTVVPMEKALKIIAKKMRVSPENIEIQY